MQLICWKCSFFPRGLNSILHLTTFQTLDVIKHPREKFKLFVIEAVVFINLSLSQNSRRFPEFWQCSFVKRFQVCHVVMNVDQEENEKGKSTREVFQFWLTTSLVYSTDLHENYMISFLPNSPSSIHVNNTHRLFLPT